MLLGLLDYRLPPTNTSRCYDSALASKVNFAVPQKASENSRGVKIDSKLIQVLLFFSFESYGKV